VSACALCGARVGPRFPRVPLERVVAINSLSYRFHSYLNRFESLESLKFSVFFCGALDAVRGRRRQSPE
jgi:hypothetical protein